MTGIVDKVAEAILLADTKPATAEGRLMMASVARAQARAAIAAMSTPTGAMLVAGDKKKINSLTVWGAMIRAALAEDVG